jgi:hypothetical protein
MSASRLIVVTRARFSRSGDSHPLGKCDEELATPMPGAMKADLIAVARLMDPPMSAAEMNRIVLSDFLYGRLSQAERIFRRKPITCDPAKTGGDTKA